MKHIVCENCGASLDFGEKCDCGMSAGMPLKSPSADKPKEVIVINKEPEKCLLAVFDKPAPMPAYIADMICSLRAKA